MNSRRAGSWRAEPLLFFDVVSSTCRCASPGTETGRTPALADPISKALAVAFPIVGARRRGLEGVCQRRVVRSVEQQFDRQALTMI
jgi:hypothetical protein